MFHMKHEEGFMEWLAAGYEAGYCSEAVCAFHNGLPMSQEEEAFMEKDGEICLPGVRLYPNSPRV